jgi:hypothetical protein
MTDRPLAARPIDADVAPGVELAEKGPDFERKVGVPAGVRNRPDPAAVDVADDDLLVERKDLGPESATFIAKGDRIPPELASLPRRPARAGSRSKK